MNLSKKFSKFCNYGLCKLSFTFRPVYLRHLTHIWLTAVTEPPEIVGIYNFMLAFLRSLYGVTHQQCLKGTPYLLVLRLLHAASLVAESKQLCLCVWDSNGRIGKSKDGCFCVGALCVCVCFKIRNNLTIVQQGYMPFISARLQYFLLYLVMLHKFMPTV
jgi:hypothetical protein